MKKKSLSTLKVKLWSLFSRWIKARDGERCFICGRPCTGSDLHAGHLVSRAKNATLYDPINVHSCCSTCNIWKHGNIASYVEKFLDKYGEKAFRELMERSKRLHQWKQFQLEEMIEKLSKEPEMFTEFYHEHYY